MASADDAALAHAPFGRVVHRAGGLTVVDDDAAPPDAPPAAQARPFAEVAAAHGGVAPGAFAAAGGAGAAAAAPAARSSVPCRLFASGACRFGARCHFAHVARAAPGDAERECGVCLEAVLGRGERFGLLLGCAHVFCLSCVREWRAQHAHGTDAARSCPVCRAHSPYVIPSVAFVADRARKEVLQAAFLANTGATRCRYWTGASGSCQFGSSCFYRHVNPDGSIGVDVTRTTVVDGEVRVVHARDRTTIADFIPGAAAAAAEFDKLAERAADEARRDEERRQREHEAALPKWARGLGDDQIAAELQRRTLAEAQSCGGDGGAAPAPAAALDRAAVESATRGFAEIDLTRAAAAPPAAPTTAPPPPAATSGDGGWTADEQARLEEVLKRFPGAASDKQRWAKIAAHVGRSRKECVTRFRECARAVEE